ncbi:uncharacterized protein C10orf82 homolog isoform X1 [Eriocheir sinensis]|uniref:uncharacterized protein C10orf82 homolog isoform X1 n=2 Tax=Eriocheir sinensis TaxID=95602 RepID=UPI0021C88255|nr:uncharacterized protein C10orf82 homolog isoform X1 [Eriocheir sinensis]
MVALGSMGELTQTRSPLFSNRAFIVGYSGYIPGLMFRYGKTFGRAAEESISLYIQQQSDRRAKEEARRSKSLPRVRQRRSETRVIEDFYSKYGIDGRSNPNYPPLPGYTGYIPKMKPTDLGIGRTFSAAARRGLAHVTTAREQRQSLQPRLHDSAPPSATRYTKAPS